MKLKTVYFRPVYVSILFIVIISALLYSSNKRFDGLSLRVFTYALYSMTTSDTPNRTTVVIGYFPLPQSKHTRTQYHSWLENLLGSCRSPMIIYTSIEYQPILHKFRGNHTVTTHFITDYKSPLQMPPIEDLVPTFERQHLTDPERAYHSVELYAVWCAKTFMLNRSAELNPFRTKYFLYIDAGGFRSPKYRFQWWPNGPNIGLALENDRLLLSMVSKLPRQFCSVSYKLASGPLRLTLIQGGIIGGSAHAIHWWTSVFYETINNYRSKNFFICKDQHSMNAIALAYPHRFNIMLSFRVPCGNVWFAYGPLLSNQEERQKLSFSAACRNQNLSDVIIPFENVCNDYKNIR